jgi:NAD+ kinase
MITVGIVANRFKPKARSAIKEFVTLLQQAHARVLYAAESAEFLKLPASGNIVALAELGGQCDVVVAFGGDGTLLSTASEVGASGVAILGVNLGGLGFLAECKTDELEAMVHDLIHGQFTVIERMVLAVRVHVSGQIKNYWALNDVVVDKGTSARLILIDTLVDGDYLNTYRSDGLIIATPTGSTAYSLSAGGPLLMPVMQAIIVTPICPHSLTVRPIVLSSASVLSISTRGQEKPVQVNIDGQNRFAIRAGDWLEISQATYSIKWVSSNKRDFFSILRTKLNWGFDLSTRDPSTME